MTIAEMRERSNQALSGVPADLLLVAVVVLFSTASFGLGILAGKGMHAPAGKDAGFWVEDISASSSALLPAAAAAATVPAPKAPAQIELAPAGAAVTPAEGKYVASKSGTKYYLPSCSGAKRIKEENKVWFASVEEATAAGLGPAANCPGL